MIKCMSYYLLFENHNFSNLIGELILYKTTKHTKADNYFLLGTYIKRKYLNSM